MRDQMASAVARAEQDRVAAVAQVRTQIEQVKAQTSLDADLQRRRENSIHNAEVILMVPERAGELPEVIEDLNGVAEEFERDARRVQENQGVANQVSETLKAVGEGLSGISTDAESIRQAAGQLTADAEMLRGQLEASKNNSASTAAQSRELSELQERVSQLALKLADVERRARRLVKSAPAPVAPAPVAPAPVAPAPVAPVPVAPAPVAPAPLTYRPRERRFESSEQGLRELVDFLSSDPRITSFDVE
jgi:predicted RNase H-like nuclease (RuvC/YqgF family)